MYMYLYLVVEQTIVLPQFMFTQALAWFTIIMIVSRLSVRVMLD